LAGNLTVSINDPNQLFTADELDRIQDAINAWDTLLAPYNVTITEVSDPTLANLVIDSSTISACGGAANGVLGCYNEPNDEITMIQGWNWYAGSDATQIGAGQYDFETTVLHELGHALGLGGSTDPNSPMFETLAAGVALRTVTTQDLNIPDPPEGADPQRAAGFRPSIPSVAIPAGPGSGTVATDRGVGMMPLERDRMARDAVLTGWSSSRSGSSKRLQVHGTSTVDAGGPSPVSGRARTSVVQATLVDSTLEEFGALPSLLNLDGQDAPNAGRKLRHPIV
jgi:hypothetical protein